MELDAFVAILIGIYQMWDNLKEVIETKKVRIDKKTATLSLIAGLLWLSYHYRTGMNNTVVITILGLIVNLYILHVIYLKEKKDKKI
jgi:hypothetical protein